ncbi:MAG: hypothetical protein RMK84_19080 [Oscillochloridaceae bacterium]|nr:hypothetical protein [Chloroflexaceae bacterium]MDW8392230.1 hypothetical protein [Oscillochloridaceae bacterium]
MPEEQERHGSRKEDEQADATDAAALEPAEDPTAEAPPPAPSPPRQSHRHTVWRWHVRRRRRKIR